MATASPLLRSLLRKHSTATTATSSVVNAARTRTHCCPSLTTARCYSYLASSATPSSPNPSSRQRSTVSDQDKESRTSAASSSSYVSPMQDFWDAVEANRPTVVDPTTTSSLARTSATAMASNSGTLRCGIPEAALRFTTTSYGRTMNAPFVHPKENSVVLKVSTRHLPLGPMEREILREIVGNRLNDERHELRLTSDQFGSRIENKRHLVSMLDRIVLSCQRLGREIDAAAPSSPASSSASKSST